MIPIASEQSLGQDVESTKGWCGDRLSRLLYSKIDLECMCLFLIELEKGAAQGIRLSQNV